MYLFKYCAIWVSMLGFIGVTIYKKWLDRNLPRIGPLILDSHRKKKNKMQWQTMTFCGQPCMSREFITKQNGNDVTPWKINVEPTNHEFRQENDLNQTSMIMFHVRGVIQKHVQGIRKCPLLLFFNQLPDVMFWQLFELQLARAKFTA